MDRIEPELILKTTPPRGQKTAQVRNRLSIDTAELAEKVVIAVQAPAGFGKTFLLTQWRRESLSHGAVVAWLTLDGQDDGDRFVQGLAAAMAIGSGRSSFAHTFERLSAKGSDELEGLTQWLAEVADLGSETLLILDEVDTLPDVTVRHSLAYLLHNAPANLRVIMASRGRLNLQVSDLMASGRYALITTPALRLSVEETVAILNGRFGARIDTDLCVRLHEITEGWPLGLQLAISAMEKSPNLRTAIEELSTCSGDIQRYFVDSLIAHLPDEQVRFLISMAFLEMVQPTLCVAVTGSPSAVELLKELCVSTPIFVEGVDSDWVRFHPLAREFLHGRFASLPLERRQGFHERAAVWLEQHGFLEQAARQYLLAGLSKPAFIMIEACLYDVMLGENSVECWSGSKSLQMRTFCLIRAYAWLRPGHWRWASARLKRRSWLPALSSILLPMKRHVVKRRLLRPQPLTSPTVRTSHWRSSRLGSTGCPRFPSSCKPLWPTRLHGWPCFKGSRKKRDVSFSVRRITHGPRGWMRFADLANGW